ncbi:MAG: hypothetical protein FWD77_03815 [Betaproteobacteria bacterium]|nr:hypothetical protein [Betaproteobacteria bacterium]
MAEYLIDPPDSFAPREKLYAFRDEMIEEVRKDPESQSLRGALEDVERAISYRDSEEGAWIDELHAKRKAETLAAA